MKSKIVWHKNLSLTAETETGHKISIDGVPDYGGENSGARPMELVLSGLGSCAAMDILIVLQNSKQPIESCEIELNGTRVDSIPSVFKAINLCFILKGNNLKESLVRSAVRMSMTRLCSVAKMLGDGGVEITYDYKLQ